MPRAESHSGDATASSAAPTSAARAPCARASSQASSPTSAAPSGTVTNCAQPAPAAEPAISYPAQLNGPDAGFSAAPSAYSAADDATGPMPYLVRSAPSGPGRPMSTRSSSHCMCGIASVPCSASAADAASVAASSDDCKP